MAKAPIIPPPPIRADPEPSAALLTAWARQAGFDRAGVAHLEPLEHGEAYLRWLEDGAHAGMEYLAGRSEVRVEPARILDGARSVLCVALRYHPLEASHDGEGGGGNDLWSGVARYARGRDYHNLMGKRLRKLARRLRETFPDCQTRHYVDTGPVLERELAARAGLGGIGKNTCLLTREGSYFFLGEIFTTLDVAPSEAQPDPPPRAPLTDLCGHCTRCLDACPTGAFPEAYRLDADRCISYWTIEHRGPLPEEWRRAVGEWVFGCDVCQEVCPWNQRDNPPSAEEDFQLPQRRGELDLIGLLALTREEYEERFRGNAMKRARLEGLKRNAATVMGNRGDERYVPALKRALAEEEEDGVREHCRWALERIRSPGSDA